MMIPLNKSNSNLRIFFRCVFRNNHENHDIETRSHDSRHLLEPVGLVWFWGITYQNFFRNFRMMFWEKSALTVLILLFRKLKRIE